jgi:anti-anti-sigma regulatory factor
MAQLVSLSGDQTIREAADTLEVLRAAVAKGGDLTLDCGGVTDADLSFIQIVMAASKSLAANGRRLGLTAPAHGPLLAALDAAGIRATGSQLFWFEALA